MLLWKCWRDLRIAFFVGLGWLALIAVAVIQHALRTPAGSAPVAAPAGASADVAAIFVLMQTVVFAIIVAAFGTCGVGRDIGSGSGSFLLTRPTPRGRFVWTEWASGLAALAVLLLLSLLELDLSVRFHAIQITGSATSGGATVVQTWSLSALPLWIAAIDVLCAFLFLALVYGITHLGTTAFHHSTAGLLGTLGFFVVWLIGTTILRHNYPWLAPHIPDLLLRPFGGIGGDHNLIPHVTASILERLAILPLFPLAAHLFLRRTEV